MVSARKKLFETDGIRGRFGFYPITEEFAEDLGRAIGMLLGLGSEKSVILVGRDTRISGLTLESFLVKGLVASGTSVELLGVTSTPALAYSVKCFSAVGGVMISASHNPFQDNGFKLFGKNGEKVSQEIEVSLEETLGQKKGLGLTDKSNASVGYCSGWETKYKDMCEANFKAIAGLEKLKIIVDCAHGSNYKVATSILKSFGLQVEQIGCQPTGYNINLSVGSTNPNRLRAAVIDSQAAIGVGFDGDGDRLVMIDERGEILDGDDILFVLANYYLSSNRKVGGVVGTSMTNLGLERSIGELGLGFERVGVGDRFVMEKLNERGWTLGGETSGHVICRDIAATGDGLLACIQVLSSMARSQRPLSELRKGLIKFPQVLVNVLVADKVKVLEEVVLEKVVEQAKKNLGDAGRILVRASGTESLIRVMVEGEDRKHINLVATGVAKTIEEINMRIS